MAVKNRINDNIKEDTDKGSFMLSKLTNSTIHCESKIFSQHVAKLIRSLILTTAVLVLLTACSNTPNIAEAYDTAAVDIKSQNYLIGPGDRLRVFVWGNTDLSTEVNVRPDGRISTPLVEDVLASGKTPAQLAREMESQLVRYIKSPVVTVMVEEFSGTFGQQIRIVGEAAQPRSIPYRENITLLDVMIAVGGLTEFASGNDASVVRTTDRKQVQFKVRVDDLVKLGDISANIPMQPGDILIIPESWF